MLLNQGWNKESVFGQDEKPVLRYNAAHVEACSTNKNVSYDS